MNARKKRGATGDRQLLARAFTIITKERLELADCYRETDGRVRDASALQYLRRYDRFLKPAALRLGRKRK